MNITRLSAISCCRVGHHRSGSSASIPIRVTPASRSLAMRWKRQFTYDLFTLLRIVPGLDANADRQVTAAELAAQTPVVIAYLRRQVQLEIDGQPADFGDPQPVIFPPAAGDAIRQQRLSRRYIAGPFFFSPAAGEGSCRFLGAVRLLSLIWASNTSSWERSSTKGKNMRCSSATTNRTTCTTLATFRLRFPSRKLSQAEPNSSLAAAASPASTPERPARRSNMNTSPWSHLAGFFRLGVEHIFLGYDHILFLLSLIVVCKFGELVKIVTSFTVAHTITLILATLRTFSCRPVGRDRHRRDDRLCCGREFLDQGRRPTVAADVCVRPDPWLRFCRSVAGIGVADGRASFVHWLHSSWVSKWGNWQSC